MWKRNKASPDATLEQVDEFFEVIGDLDGTQRAAVLDYGRERLGRPVRALPPDPDEIPAPGQWELYGELSQLEELLGVFKASSVDARLQMIAYARELKAAEPALPPGYAR
jgi:hypothetical protein